ncbi:hypothetical protein C1I95_17590 [Micromonospora craterilacus]|uniref:HTH cro/C1-type domain-containing protein n=1 Tax=Micromonospora craterilacus TaxID=1655439 RepID=A0A2W2EI53_9ACTN|nr:helix-turn-helix transcriptional regulator [Micromonospora craterilacus]PZG16485.1 hypothetical protein C1I95_17590 [Micromonospora craterilacus]
MITASPGGTPHHLDHQPVAATDFPHLDPTTGVCRACSYTADGAPIVPIGWPCPPIHEDKQPAGEARRKRYAGAGRLADQVTARRTQLGLTRNQLAEQSGIGVKTLRSVEEARFPRPADHTLEGLDRGLDWRAGSARRVLAGGEPQPRPSDVVVPAEQQVILRAGLPAEVETALIGHLQARRQDVEAALEDEARMLLGQTLRLAHLGAAGSAG